MSHEAGMGKGTLTDPGGPDDLTTAAPAEQAEPVDRTEQSDQAVQVLGALAGCLGITVGPTTGLGTTTQPMAKALRAIGVRARPVRLTPGWSTATVMPMVGFATDGHPVALVPSRGGYRVYDPVTGRSTPAGSRGAPALSARALALYRALPSTVVSLSTLLRFALVGARRDLVMLLVSGLMAGLLGLAVPTAAGLLLPRLISDDAGQMWWIGGLLAATTLTGGLMLLVRNAAAVRLQGRLQASLEPAVWDRLLRQDVGFFRDFTTGDLVHRANAIAEARRTLSDVLVGALLGAFFSLASMILVVVIDWFLGAIVLGTAGLVVACLLLLARRQQRHESVVYHTHGQVYGLLYPLLLGIDKIQAAGREVQAFARWASIFGRQKVADAASLRIQAGSTGLVAAVQPALFAALLGGIVLARPSIAVTHVLVAGVAVGQLALAVGQVGHLAAMAFGVAPVLDRLRPLLAEPPERHRVGTDPGTLRGAVSLDAVSFQYPGNTTETLSGVSLYAHPGELIAIVGASGAGKSTLIRLLLGFDQPQVGAVHYDDQALSSLDLQLVRQQIGTVLQHGRLLRGTLLENILGPATDLTEADAWAAAELAGIAADLRRLPLGLTTTVGEDSHGFSGGQIQRILIARALVRRPAILLLDEATSALDNATQQLVSDRIGELACTRLVVAHRLSTIRRADRIYVLDTGRVVAEGSYQDLVQSDPAFARLVRRQEA